MDSELMPEEGSETANAFVNMDNAFLIFFILELIFAIFVWGKSFFNSGAVSCWCCQRFSLVILSLAKASCSTQVPCLAGVVRGLV